MKFLNITKRIAALAIVAAAFTSCEKDEKVNEVFGAGRTIVHMIGAGHDTLPGINKNPIDFVAEPTILVAADIRRDVPNEDALNTTVTVTIKDDTASVAKEGYIHLDPSWYELVPTPGITKVGGQGGTYTVTFAPGEFAKPIKIRIADATVMDPSSLYALGFEITSTDPTGILAHHTAVIVEIGAKNKYDGLYLLKGIHNRPTFQFFYETEVEMHTIGASSVRFFFNAAGAYGHPIATAPGNTLSWYGTTMSPAVEFDPDTDLATDIFQAWPGGTVVNKNDGNNYPDPPDPDAPTISRYDAATKTMYLYWKYSNNVERAFFDTLTYLGPR